MKQLTNAAMDRYGFSTAMLGVTGFESASNYIESQKPGVFPRVLRNVWALLTVQNFTLAFLVTALVPMEELNGGGSSSEAGPSGPSSDTLAILAQHAGYSWLEKWVRVDAFIVLSGAVLTAYVGIIGLVERLAHDHCLPQILLQKNRLFHTTHWITIAFFLLCMSLYWMTNHTVTALSGVYTMAFLSVLLFVGSGNLLIKYKRKSLPRVVRAHWAAVVAGMVCIALALVGNVVMDTNIIKYFAAYFVAFAAVVLVLIYRVPLITIILNSGVVGRVPLLGARIQAWLVKSYHKRHQITDRVDVLRKAVQYVYDNELTNGLTVVHMYESSSDIPLHLVEHVALLDAMFPKLQVNLLVIKGKFCPASVDLLVRTLSVPRNNMFIGCPDTESPIPPSELSGLRIIMH
eukprot:m51a1_g12553 hypothetical protein (403) ;mRNA; r:906-2281